MSAAPEPIELQRLLEWVYVRQLPRITYTDVDGARLASGRDSCLSLQEMVMFGYPLRFGGITRERTHADAETVNDIVQALPDGRQRWLIIRGARVGPPNWRPGARPRFEPEYVQRRGQWVPRVVWDQRQKRPSYCPVVLHDDPRAVAACRAEYLAWWHAIGGLMPLIGGRLGRWIVQPLVAPMQPWLTADSPAIAISACVAVFFGRYSE